MGLGVPFKSSTFSKAAVYPYVDVEFSFCLISNYIKDNSLKDMKNRTFFMLRQTFTMTNSMAFQVCGKMLYLPQLAPLNLCKEWHLVPNGLAPNCWCRNTHIPVLYDVDTGCVAPFTLCKMIGCVGQVQWVGQVGEGLHKVEDSGIRHEDMYTKGVSVLTYHTLKFLAVDKIFIRNHTSDIKIIYQVVELIKCLLVEKAFGM